MSFAIFLGHDSQLAALSPLFYMWVPIFAFTYFSTRAALLQVAWIAVSFSVAVGITVGAASLGRTVVVLGVLVVTSAAVHSLVGEIRRLARTDPLTGLVNRRVFIERLQGALIRGQRTHTPPANPPTALTTSSKRADNNLYAAKRCRRLPT